jgi:riboflavin synthase
MFTGIVEELGEVVALDRLVDGARLRVRGKTVAADANPGDSIAVNGVCLTVVDLVDDEFTADVMKESLDRSNLGGLVSGEPVNLERSVRAGGRLGGHLVQGHVDGVGTLLNRTPSEHWEVVRVGLPDRLARYVAEKGSIAVDGVSLTVVQVGEADFSVALIPTTLQLTTLGRRSVGDALNLEVDVIAKYVARLLAVPAPATQMPQLGTAEPGAMS